MRLGFEIYHVKHRIPNALTYLHVGTYARTGYLVTELPRCMQGAPTYVPRVGRGTYMLRCSGVSDPRQTST